MAGFREVNPRITSIISSLLLLIIVGRAWADAPPLSKAHAHLDNSGKCNRCHEVWEGVEDRKCLACHKEIKSRIAKGKGYHARVNKKCQKCHREHRGRRGKLIKIPSSFDHDDTGYRLEGRHAKVRCKECHTKKRPKSKLGTRTYLFDRTPSCASCHPDIHGFSRSGLGRHCERCHNAYDWRTLNARIDFDHTRLTDYPLKGEHKTVKCGKCHRDRRKFAPLRHKTCDSCHEDVHSGAFSGYRCRDCHTEAGWSRVRFRHDKVGFPLLGEHKRVRCLDCHEKEQWSGIPKDCKACHESEDPHRGQFGNRPCSRCHQSGSWTRLVFDHVKQSSFPLLGKHKTLSCKRCHPPYGKSLKFKGVDGECKTCHEKDDRHGGQFGDKPCSNCHRPDSWHTIVFDHTVTRFPLEGRHSRTMCDKCHPGGNTEVKQPMVCRACHADIHEGQFGNLDCKACHGFQSFAIEDFDHDRANWPLTGKHAQLECSDCHQGGRFKPIDHRCRDCHRDFHEGQFGKKPCDVCHVTDTWSDVSAKFVHDRDSRFPLLGAHEALECEKCHFNNRFKPLDRECGGCHIDIHQGDKGPDCGDCHNQTDWRVNAGIAHDFGRFKLEGAHDTIPCERCHVGSRKLGGTGVECVNCHRDPHFGALGPFCADCHDQKEWIPARFKHWRTGYRLTGEHRFVPCKACHMNNVWGGLPTACEFCHLNQWMRTNQQPGLCNHAIRHWGPGNCENCHTTRGWDRLRPGIRRPQECAP